MGEQTKMLKSIVIACLATVALAEAEAEPYLLYGGLGYGHLGYSHLGYSHLGYGHGFVYGKREAEAEPEAKPEAEADPYLLYGRGLGYYGGYYGHGLGYAGYYGHGLGYSVFGKRSADAEAKPDPYYLAYGHGYAGHLGYGHLGYPGLGYGGYYLGK